MRESISESTYNSTPKQQNGSVKNQVIAAIFMNFCQLAHGSNLGWMSPMAVYLQEPDSPTGSPMSSDIVFWATSSVSIGASLGVSVIGYISQRYGRKPAAICTCIPTAISWILVISYLNEWTLIISRILAGITCSSSYLICAMYTGEVSDAKIRGTLGSVVLFVNTAGVVIGYLVGGYLQYRIAAGVLLIFSVAHIVSFMVLPETPVYLVKQGKIEDAKRILGYFKSLPSDNKEVEEEIERLRLVEESVLNAPKLTLKGIMRDPANRKAIFILVVLANLVVFNGGFVVTSYVGVIFDAALNTADDDEVISLTLQSTIVGVLMLIGCLLSILTIDRFGRKPLLLSSLIICGVSIGGLGAWFYLTEQQLISIGWLPLVFLGIFVMSNIGGAGTIVYVFVSELFKFEVRSFLSTIHFTIQWFSGFVALIIFNPLIQWIGEYGTMWLFAGVNFIAFVFAIIFFPETKQKTIEQITRELLGK